MTFLYWPFFCADRNAQWFVLETEVETDRRAEFPNLSYMYDCRQVLDDPLELPPNGPEPPRTKTGLVSHAAGLQQGFEGQKLQALSAKGPGLPLHSGCCLEVCN